MQMLPAIVKKKKKKFPKLHEIIDTTFTIHDIILTKLVLVLEISFTQVM